ncbi:hypothetical protein CEXT_542391 [Caerostris extrusa]|uniref:Uncharacterized protein n=1 Tax=Caerostris extrusa TaxID=172846 RepID=A0AAV4NKU3_CAEEX|nr:hypothetical protein CEXT_542391 [Caerostris extrusa]
MPGRGRRIHHGISQILALAKTDGERAKISPRAEIAAVAPVSQLRALIEEWMAPTRIRTATRFSYSYSFEKELIWQMRI